MGNMTGTESLVPVFIPPLATLLAKAESVKGSRLTESEVLRIRDRAICMMIAPEQAAKMSESRGYRDVEPENCWADWHRLRVEQTGNGYLPKIVLCVLGDASLESPCGQLLKSESLEHEWREHDERMVSAFEASACRCDPSLTGEDLINIGKHSRVLYVLSRNFSAQDGPSASRDFLRLGGRLLELGAIALKCDSSGIAHGRARWLELAREAAGDEFSEALVRAYVQLPIWNGEDFYTCGLHLLGLPDLIVSDVLLRTAHGSSESQGWNSVDLFRTFAGYLLSECTPGKFSSGHTFSLSASTPRFRVSWEECTGYDEDDFFYNPFGRWRFAELAQRR